MPTLPISHFAWQVLRAAKRSKKPLTGQELRVSPSRGSKDGTFLDDLVNEGLLEVVGVDQLPRATESQKQILVQFRTRHRLTEKGQDAAEYGEYEREMRPKQK